MMSNTLLTPRRTKTAILPVFGRQDEAFTTADSMEWRSAEDEQCVWAFEGLDMNGGRAYLVKKRDDFWDMYGRLRPEERTFYEIIRARHPCCMYFDLGKSHSRT